MYDDIRHYWQELASAMQAMPYHHIVEIAEVLLDCHHRGGTIFLLGNGGSAATASHFACDLAKGTLTTGLPAFRVIALNDNMPLMTAWANDTSYEHVFEQQLAALVRSGDIVILISASGNSPNILAAAREAQRSEALVIALTGASGGQLARIADLALRVPTSSIEQAEDAHLIIAHSLCVAIRQHLTHEVLAIEQAFRAG